MIKKDTLNKNRPELEKWIERHRHKIGFGLILILILGFIVYLWQNNIVWDNSSASAGNQPLAAALENELKKTREENDSIREQIENLNKKIDELKNELAANNNSQSEGNQSVNQAAIPASSGKVAGTSASATKSNPSGIININTASAAELDRLPGVGPARAQAIIEYRNANNGFKTADEIMNIKGIGPATFEKMKGMITVR